MQACMVCLSIYIYTPTHTMEQQFHVHIQTSCVSAFQPDVIMTYVHSYRFSFPVIHKGSEETAVDQKIQNTRCISITRVDASPVLADVHKRLSHLPRFYGPLTDVTVAYVQTGPAGGSICCNTCGIERLRCRAYIFRLS